MKITLFFFLSLMASLTGVSVMASDKLDFATVYLVTYRCYLDKKWDSVILVGKQALRQDIDYYYLRVRMGIAYFEKAAYFPAATHLKKARQFNSDDPVIASYLYYAYLYSNRVEEAASIPGLEPKDKPGVSPGEVHAEGGYTLCSDTKPDNLANLMGNDSIYGEQDLYGNSFYSNLGLKLKISNRVSFTFAYNYLNFSKTKYIQYGHAEALLDSTSSQVFSKDYFYSFPWKIHDTAFKYNVIQQEGYFKASAVLPGGIKIEPAVHLLHLSNPLIKSTVTDSVSDTAYYSYIDNTYHLFKYPSVSYTWNTKDTSFSNWVVSLALSKDFGIFNIGLNGSWSNLNGKKQKQI
ncbi:MAG: hypothetical protein NTW16_15835, partial [Bacteroidetes bacterium]|nr:hypothetical protein [Bacteroidota bacterium]